MTLSAFAKRAGLGNADIYRMQIDQIMSPEGEYNVCVYLGVDCADIRDISIPDPDDPTRFVMYPGKKSREQWAKEAAERRRAQNPPPPASCDTSPTADEISQVDVASASSHKEETPV